jgi:tetratricopeptide (TPR) repeat protein
VSLRLNISAGEFFDLIRPAVLICSALLSTWVLTNARQRRFPIYISAAWALGTLFFPLIIFPLYLIAQSIAKRRERPLPNSPSGQSANPSQSVVRWQITVSLLYAAVVLFSTGLYLYRDYRSLDAHLARAAQARLTGERSRAINEYRVALEIEDNPHTHKLLAIQLAEAGDWTEALAHFRLAERGGEPDNLISFRSATMLDALNNPLEAVFEYQRFLQSGACTQQLPDYRCAVARARVKSAPRESH